MAPPDLVGPFARAMALVSDDFQGHSNVFVARRNDFLSISGYRESIVGAVGEEILKLRQ